MKDKKPWKAAIAGIAAGVIVSELLHVKHSLSQHYKEQRLVRQRNQAVVNGIKARKAAVEAIAAQTQKQSEIARLTQIRQANNLDYRSQIDMLRIMQRKHLADLQALREKGQVNRRTHEAEIERLRGALEREINRLRQRAMDNEQPRRPTNGRVHRDAVDSFMRYARFRDLERLAGRADGTRENHVRQRSERRTEYLRHWSARLQGMEPAERNRLIQVENTRLDQENRNANLEATMSTLTPAERAARLEDPQNTETRDAIEATMRERMERHFQNNPDAIANVTIEQIPFGSQDPSQYQPPDKIDRISYDDLDPRCTVYITSEQGNTGRIQELYNFSSILRLLIGRAPRCPHRSKVPLLLENIRRVPAATVNRIHISGPG